MDAFKIYCSTNNGYFIIPYYYINFSSQTLYLVNTDFSLIIVIKVNINFIIIYLNYFKKFFIQDFDFSCSTNGFNRCWIRFFMIKYYFI